MHTIRTIGLFSLSPLRCPVHEKKSPINIQPAELRVVPVRLLWGAKEVFLATVYTPILAYGAREAAAWDGWLVLLVSWLR